METGFNFWLGKMAAEAVVFVGALLLVFAIVVFNAWWQDRKRCPSRYRRHRCVGRRGHTYKHLACPPNQPSLYWTDEEAA